MEVVTHHPKPEQIHAEHASEKFEPILNPLSSVILILTRNRIISAKEPTSHTPIDAMHHLNLTVSQHFTRQCHSLPTPFNRPRGLNCTRSRWVREPNIGMRTHRLHLSRERRGYIQDRFTVMFS